MPDTIVSVAPLCAALVAHHRRAFDARRAAQIIPRRHKLYTAAHLDRRPTRGDKLLADLRAALRLFDECNEYTRSVHQKQFHESMLAACIRHIYQDEYDENFAAILAANNWSIARQEPVVILQSTCLDWTLCCSQPWTGFSLQRIALPFHDRIMICCPRRKSPCLD